MRAGAQRTGRRDTLSGRQRNRKKYKTNKASELKFEHSRFGAPNPITLRLPPLNQPKVDRTNPQSRLTQAVRFSINVTPRARGFGVQGAVVLGRAAYHSNRRTEDCNS